MTDFTLIIYSTAWSRHRPGAFLPELMRYKAIDPTINWAIDVGNHRYIYKVFNTEAEAALFKLTYL